MNPPHLRVAGLYLIVGRFFVDAGIRAKTRSGEAEAVCGLRECLDDHHARHDGPAGEVSAKERLVISQVLERPNAVPEAVLEHAADEQKG